MKRRHALTLIPAILPLRLRAAEASWPGNARLYINYQPHPPADTMRLYSHCIVDALAQFDRVAPKSTDTIVLAYVSLMETANGTERERQAKARGVEFAGQNRAWASQLMLAGRPAWREFIWQDCVQAAMQAGFDGIFCDTLDSAHLLPQLEQKKQAETGIVTVLQDVRKRWPTAQIWVNRGFDLLPELKQIVDTVLVESIYQTFDPTTKRYRAVEAAGSSWLEERMQSARRLGMRLCAVDYVSPTSETLAQKTLERLQALDALALITTPDLKGEIVAPKLPSQLKVSKTPPSQGQK